MAARNAPGTTYAFRASIARLGELYCVAVPAAVSRAIGVRGRVPVVVRFGGGEPYRSTLLPSGGGRHRLFANAAARRGARTGRLSIELRVDREPRAVETPGDLAAALEEAGARQAWEAMTPSLRAEILHWIDDAARDVTRAKRLARAVQEALARRERALDRRDVT